MNFTLHQLRVFMTVVEKESVTRAADELSMTQPAVSIQLRNLQDQFDLPITEIVGRRLYVTDFGRDLYGIAARIIGEVEGIAYRTERFKGLLSGRLSLSVASTGKYVIPYYLRDFLKAHPSVDLTMDVTNKTRVVRSLENNEVDFALVSVLPEKLDIDQEVLLPNPLYLTCAHGVRPPGRGIRDRSLFREIPMIYREDGSGTRFAMQHYFQRANIVPRVRVELTSTEAVKQAVIAGLGFSILSLLSIRNELRQKQIRIIPVKGLPLTEHWRLVWLAKKNLSLVAKAFLDHVRAGKDAIYSEHFSWIETH
jgi:DNA-binding transcriptional LysR family regulator